MKKPDTLIARYSFLIFIGFLIFIIFSIIMWILRLSGRCSVGKPEKEVKEKKKKNTFMYVIIFILVCSMAAQAVNQSYTRIVK